ncbi:hypothetical protein [Ekhidna sp.]|uniref:hypothetical protein n=1 Tax=Ekhidna sp. TaxID=2608089 RepID=UPI003CCC3123
MKINKLIFLFAILIGIGFTSCKEDELVGASSLANVVYLQDTTTTIGENGSSTSIVVFRTTSDFSQSLTVDLEVSATYASTTPLFDAGDAAPGTYTLSKTSVSFDANVSSDTIVITSVDDLASSGDKNVSITLTNPSVSSYSVGTASNAGFYASVTAVIQDDDCPIDLAGDWAGDYDISEEFTAGGNAGLSFGFTGPISLAADASDAAGITALLGTSFFLDDTPVTFNTCPQTLSFDENPLLLGFTVNGEQAAYDIFEATFTSGNQITIVGNMGNVAGSNFGEYTVVLTKQ